DKARLVRRIAHEPLPPPRRLDPRIPRDLETVILKATAKDPAARYADAAALADDLRCFLQHRPVRARRAGWAERPRRGCRRPPALAATRALAAAALLALAAAVLGQIGAWNALDEMTHEQRRAEERLALLRQTARASQLQAARLGRDRGLLLCKQG